MNVTIKETGEVLKLGGLDEFGNDVMLMIAEYIAHYREIEVEYDWNADGAATYFLTAEQYAFWVEYLRLSEEDAGIINALIERHGEGARKIMIRLWEADEYHYTEHHRVNLEIIEEIERTFQPLDHEGD